jgi:signal transduction histidine kinase
LPGVLHARMLRADLQRARERLVLAREEERRRLRRDLHDGPGHGLAIMRERAEELGGAVTITNGSPGVTVRAWLPAMPSPAPLPAAATAAEPQTAQPQTPRVPAMPG